MLAWVVLVLALAAALIVGIDRLLKWLGIHPERPEDVSGGVRDLIERVEQWQNSYARRHK